MMQTIYFDNAATTKPCPEAVEAFMQTVEHFGNPSSAHTVGARAAEMLIRARTQVAFAIGAQPDEITFTSGGTEADNLAIRGACDANKQARKVIISAVEHPAVYRVCRYLKKQGYEIVKIACSMDGFINEEQLLRAVDEQTALVSFMMVNNETGTIFPIKRIAQLVKEKCPTTLVHTDAVQALGKFTINVADLGVDMLTLSAHKVGGFKGAGALYVRSGVEIYPLVFGGGQEAGLRSGTEATPALCAFGAAAKAAAANIDTFQKNAAAIKARIVAGLGELDGCVINSAPNGSPSILNFTALGHDAATLLAALSERGICISKGAACKTNHKNGPSMLMSFGLEVARADNALRLSFGVQNTLDEADIFLAHLREILSR